MIYKILKSNMKLGGFTLVETLVAISILLVGISAAFSAAQSSLSATSEVRDRITAIFLAQEAMEMARNLKDQNLLIPPPGPSDWLVGLVGSDACSNDKNRLCDFNFTFGEALEFVACDDTPNDCLLNVDFEPAGFLEPEKEIGHYTHETGILTDPSDGGIDREVRPSKFRRKISVDDNSSGLKKEAQITVSVTWTSRGRNYEFVLRDSLFNWFTS